MQHKLTAVAQGTCPITNYMLSKYTKAALEYTYCPILMASKKWCSEKSG